MTTPDDIAPEEIRGTEKKEAYHQACEATVKPFKFDRPDNIPLDRKAFVKLAGNDGVQAQVQIINQGGDNNLHYHANMDSIFMVLKGKVKFYGPDDAIIGDFGTNEGVHMPAGARYWFETSGDGESWLLQIATYPKGRKMGKRIDSVKQKEGGIKTVHIDAATMTEIERHN